MDAYLHLAAIVVGATLIATAWCQTFPTGYERLAWRRLRASLTRPTVRLRDHDHVQSLDITVTRH